MNNSNNFSNFSNNTNHYNYENKNRIVIFIISGLCFFTSIIFVIIFSISKPRLLEFELNNLNNEEVDSESSDDDLISDIN